MRLALLVVQFRQGDLALLGGGFGLKLARRPESFHFD